MEPTSRGFAPSPGYLTNHVSSLSVLNDRSMAAINLVPLDVISKCRALGAPTFITPLSEFGERAVYTIIEYHPLLDSSNMGPVEWTRIANDIRDLYKDWDAFLILHGTDTMSFTASVLAFWFSNLRYTRTTYIHTHNIYIYIYVNI